MPLSGIKQDPIWVRKIVNNQAYIRLRKNFNELKEVDDEGKETTTWEYDEVDVIIPNRTNLIEYVKNNFDTVWYTNPEELAKLMLSK